MTLQTSRAICGTNRDRTALMYSTFRAEKQKQCPKKSGDAGEGIGNYVSPNRVLRRNRVRALPEPERDEKDSTVSSNRTLIRNRFRALPEPERDERNSTVSPTRAPRRNRVRTLPEPERDEKDSTVSPNRALRRNRVRTLPEPERDERNSNVSPNRALRRNRVLALPEPERDERNQRNLCGHSSRFCRPRLLLRPSRFRSRRGASTRCRPLRGRGGPATDRAFSQPPQSKDKAHRKNSKELSTVSDFNDFTGVSDKFF